MQLSHLWQEIANYHSMLWTLMTWTRRYWAIYSDVYWSSDFEDLYEKQTADSMISELSEYSIEV